MTDRNREGGTFERVGESMGEAAGRVAGRMTDAAFNATGAVFNSMAAMLGTWWSSANASQAAQSFEQREPACRQHHEARSTSGSSASSYERSRPLYQFGHVAGQNPDYQGRSFSEVEPELRRAWEAGGTNEYGPWDDVRDYVGYGYSQGTGSPGLDRENATGDSAAAGRGSGDMSASGRGSGAGDMNAAGRMGGSLDIDERGVHGHVEFGGGGQASGAGGAGGGSQGRTQGGGSATGQGGTSGRTDFDDPLGGGGI